MLTINTNISSLIVQSNLKQSTNGLNRAIERMTTGFKINHAKDNAANYGISAKMSSQISSYVIAEENVSMGLDMVSTASGALDQINDRLARLRALALQSQNAVYDSSSINALNNEANALMEEITRINETTQYNGINLFSSGKKEVTNIGKELEVNADGFIDEVVKVDTSFLTALSDVDRTSILAAGTYSISSKEELMQLAEMTNNGLLEAGSTFVLAADIDLKGVKWQVIGTETSPFEGNFNGNGYTISNLTDSGSNWNPMGLLGIIKNSNISNIKMINTRITGGQKCGSIVAQAASSVIKNCSSINAYFNGGWNQGGIISSGNSTTVEACYVSGDIGGYSIVGGIASSATTVNRCYFNGNVQAGTSAGGICGGAVNVNGCRSSGIVTAENSYAGGIAGNKGSFKDCYSDSIVSAPKIVGGIVGQAHSTHAFSNNIFEGTVSGDESVGWFIGNDTGITSSHKIENCSYYSRNNSEIPLVGSGMKAPVINVQDLYIPTEYMLQVGINSSDTSTLSYTTLINFSGLSSLLSHGIDNEKVLNKIDDISGIVANKQVELGAIQNRLESIIENINIHYENLVSSRSTLRDADVAEESSAYIRNQILQEAAATLLATANQTPAIALQLL